MFLGADQAKSETMKNVETFNRYVERGDLQNGHLTMAMGELAAQLTNQESGPAYNGTLAILQKVAEDAQK